MVVFQFSGIALGGLSSLRGLSEIDAKSEEGNKGEDSCFIHLMHVLFKSHQILFKCFTNINSFTCFNIRNSSLTSRIDIFRNIP